MADFPIYLEAPIPGESPFVDVVTPVLAGDIEVKIYAGRDKDAQLQHWELARGIHNLTCSADVANRKISHKTYWDFGQGVSILGNALISNANITASQTSSLAYVPYSGLLALNEYYGTLTSVVRSGVTLNMIRGKDYLHWYISNGQASDTHQVIATFKYLNYEMGIEFKS